MSPRHAVPEYAPDEHEMLSGAIWALVQATGHLPCGGWSLDSRGEPPPVTCACGTALGGRPA